MEDLPQRLEPADSTVTKGVSIPEGFLLAGGFAAVVWTPEKLQKVQEGVRQNEEKRKKPPKPPRGGLKIPIGRVALGNT